MPGINPFQLAGVDFDKLANSGTIPSSAFGAYGSIPFICPAVKTISGTTTYDVWPVTTGNPFPEGIVVTRFRGIMRGAGAGGMTIKLQLYRKSNSTAYDITDTISLAALADTDTFEEAKLNDSYMFLVPGDSLRIVTAANPLTFCYAEAIKI